MTITLYIFSFVCIAIVLIYSIWAIYLFKRAKDLNPLNKERDDLQREIAAAHNSIADANTEIKQLRIEKNIAENIIAKGAAMQQYLENNQDKEAKLRDDINRIEFEHKEVSSKLVKATQELQQLDINIQEKQGALTSIEQSISSETLKESELKRSIDIAEDRLKNDEIKLDSLNKEISEKTKDFNELDAKVKSRKEELESLKKEENRVSNNCSELKKEKTSLKNSIDELEAKKSVLAPTVLEYESKQKHAEKATSEKWKDLEAFKPIAKIENAKKLNEKEFLAEFKSALKDYNIKFDERTINAFHTGLKVQDSSPITVLAGTSGTGKSLLPKLYAEFLGMEFLPIAVQPRWDSPQDMFGFYNYMEQQFKATELSRMLWACDIYNNDKAKELYKNRNNLPMNIVLLDEMNLAKVEYYFSDMLSKLELRRTLNESDNEKRKGAEIELEASGSSTAPRKLYVGKNTLFVGTMNEDESTQSLSDKVMDRANVMRFGRPESLNINPDLEDFSKKAKSINLQTNFGDWNNFNAEKKHNGILEELAENINKELDKVGKSFAHRVWQAMYSYVNNYPDQSPDGIKYAIADQVEMKILPKLNGLEKDDPNASDVLNKIQEYIKVLDDEKLNTSFNNAKEDTHNVFFQWRGITR